MVVMRPFLTTKVEFDKKQQTYSFKRIFEKLQKILLETSFEDSF